MIHMNCLVWNVRGIGGSGKASVIRNLVLSRNPAVMGSVETKHSTLTMQLVRRWWGKDNFSWEDIPVSSGSGGLVIVWDMSSFLKTDCKKGERWICIQGKLVDKDLLVCFVFVYGLNDREERKIVWKELIDLKQMVNVPMMILCDFNEVLKP